MYILCILGLSRSVINRQEAASSLIIAAAIGTLLSVPFAPPIDAEKMRAYAATITYLGILPIAGVLFILEKVKALSKLMVPPASILAPNSMAWVSSILVILVLGAPLVVLAFRQPLQFAEITCPPGEEAVYTHITPGSYIRVVEDTTLDYTRLPNIEESKYRQSIHNSMHSSYVPELTNISPPMVIMSAYELKSGHEIWLFIPDQMVAEIPAVLGVCGEWSVDNPLDWFIHAFHARSVVDASSP